MNFGKYRMLAAACASSSLMACGAEPDQASVGDEREEVTRILTTHGFDTSNLQFIGDEVIVEGDMVMSIQAILDAASRDVEKGYFHSNLVFGAKAPENIRLVFESDLPTVWRTAFKAAAIEWNAVSGIEITADANPFITPLLVSWQPFYTSIIPLVLDTGTHARGYYPPWNGQGEIDVNSAYSGTCYTGTTAATRRKKTAMHEIGHTLGLKHRQEGQHIPGTASGSTYPTVMANGCGTIDSLQPDDLLSGNILYP